jgi:acyl-coenzyme A synthetase/AMP-(fatty) acid ligase/acyl carrier protein
LLNGGRLVLSPPRSLSLDELGDLIERSGVTSLWLTAGLFHQMVDHRLDSFRGVRQMLAGGDVLSPSHVKRYLKTLDADRCLINGYGPTENTTFTCCHVMRAASEIEHTVPIGRPIANTRVYVLAGDGRPCPIGVPGELCIGGDGVARGYHNRNELSAARFVDDPFSDDPDTRMYRTGDIVRWRLDGTIEFLGRDDDQVKVRGYRIEPGEIESAMAAHPAVRQAVVVAREDTPGDKRLVGYYIAEAEADGSSAIEQSLREKLKQRLPDYMVPAAFVALDEFPLTPNGKVDRSALPAPDFASAREYVAPRTPVEETLAEIFSDVLGVERVGIHDDFFELGGHSLMATQVVSRVRQSLAFEAPLSALFDFPTVAEFSSGLDTSTTPSRFEEGLETFEL